MKAAVLHGNADIRCEDVPLPTLGPGEILVKVHTAGVCGSDVARVQGKGTYHYPIILGHEFTGEIVENAHGTPGFSPGDRVTAFPLIPCYQCDYCRSGYHNLCDNYSYLGSRTDGGLAEYVKVPSPNLLHLPPHVSFESGATIEAASAGLHVVRKAGIQPGDSVAIFGTGPIGLYAVQWARLFGATTIIAVDLFRRKLSVAQQLGADVVIDAAERDPVEEIIAATGGKGVAAALELAGAPTTQNQCLLSTRKLGTVVFYGISHHGVNLSEQAVNRLLRGELRIVGGWNAHFAPLPMNEWAVTLEYLNRGLLQSQSMITHRYCLEDVATAFEMLERREEPSIKVLFVIGDAGACADGRGPSVHNR